MKSILFFIIIFFSVSDCENRSKEQRAKKKFFICTLIQGEINRPSSDVRGALTGKVGCFINYDEERK